MGAETTMATRVIRHGDRAVAQKVPVWRLHITAPGVQPMAMEVGKLRVRVGSAPQGNDVVIPDKRVSRFHFEIGADELGARMRDLGSTNGTYVDGYRANDMYLRPGSVIHAGRAEMIFEPLGQEVDEALSEEDSFGPLVGRSAAMRRLFSILARVAPAEATVLIEGETGTGKELVAQAIHGKSLRARGPFVVVDCASVPANILQGELFGYEKGAFSGADARHIGLIEQASGGTLFLDEIGELPLDLQPNLLRALESRQIRRLGARRTEVVDIRVVAATNRDLAKEVNHGRFREDLYFRLSVVRVETPPLRKRLEDIPLLVAHLIRHMLSRDPKRAEAVIAGLSPAAFHALETYPWSGNVRELRNVVERTLVMSGPEGPATFSPSGTRAPQSSSTADGDGQALTYPIDIENPYIPQRDALLEQYERAYLTAQLERHGRKVSPAARAAGIDRMYFKRLMKKRGIIQ